MKKLNKQATQVAMLGFIIFVAILTFNGAHALSCRTVEQNQHHTSTMPFYGFNNETIIRTRIQFNENAARYLFPPTENRGRMCTQSYNAVWGSTRCGFFSSQLKDSDRFVFRRAGSCLQYDSEGRVVAERAECPEANMVELAASAYDGGRKPHESRGVLLKEFSTKLRTDTWYRFQMTFEETKTTYQLSDDANQVLEVHAVEHRACPDFNQGWIQGLYFGGQCRAPQTVSVCYD